MTAWLPGTSGSPSILNATPEAATGGGYRYPDHQTPWQEIQRTLVEPLDRGMVLEGATAYRDVARKSPPRDNH